MEQEQWKNEAMKKLEHYHYHEAARDSIRFEIKRLKMDFVSIHSSIGDGMPSASRSGAGDDKLLNNITLRGELERKLQAEEAWITGVDHGLAALTDEERSILDARYIHPVPNGIEALCQRLNVERATAYRRSDAAMRHFVMAMYGGEP